MKQNRDRYNARYGYVEQHEAKQEADDQEKRGVETRQRPRYHDGGTECREQNWRTEPGRCWNPENPQQTNVIAPDHRRGTTEQGPKSMNE